MTRRGRLPPAALRRAIAVACIAVLMGGAAGVFLETQAPPPKGPDILVYAEKDYINTANWVTYLAKQGFRVRVEYDPLVNLMHRYLHVPVELRSVHTALVEGYVIEGEVPAEDIRRLLAERPHARGLAVPGTPGRAPGMEGLARDDKPYQVILFGGEDEARVFATH